MLRTRAALGFLVLLASSVAPACSHGPAAPACDPFIRAECAKLAECAPASLQSAYRDVDECVATIEPQCEGAVGFGSTGTGVTPAFVAACASAVNAQSCDDFLIGKTAAACAFPPGPSADGASCFTGQQCRGGYCQIHESFDPCGQCAEAESPPAGCGGAAGCPSGEVCTSTNQCMPPLQEGASCAGATTPCAPGLTCPGDGNGGLPLICSALPGVGETCAGPQTACAGDRFSCVDTTCAIGPCFTGPVCVGADCVLGANGATCLAFVPLGSACGGVGAPTCAPGAECGPAGTCVALAATPPPVCP